jgi:hypothetical protein
MRARILNAMLGLWLFFSTFLWPQTLPQRVTGWVIGLLSVTAALAGLSGGRGGRTVNAALGGWLIVSALFLPRMGRLGFWNDLAVGIGLVFFATMTDLPPVRGKAGV